MNARAIVLRGDAAHLPLPDASVDLIVTSPPYFGLRSYTDGGEHYGGQIGSEATPREYIAALLDCTREWVRCLKPSGSLFVNLGDKYSGDATPGGVESSGLAKQRGGSNPQVTARRQPRRPPAGRPKCLLGMPWRYALGCIDQLGLILRAEIVWAKPNGLPESVTDRVRRSHEQVFHFTRLPRYFAAVDEVREAHAPHRSAGSNMAIPSGPDRSSVLKPTDPSRQAPHGQRVGQPPRQAARFRLGDTQPAADRPGRARRRPLRRVPHGAAAPHHPRLVTVRHLHRVRRGTAAGGEGRDCLRQ